MPHTTQDGTLVPLQVGLGRICSILTKDHSEFVVLLVDIEEASRISYSAAIGPPSIYSQACPGAEEGLLCRFS